MVVAALRQLGHGGDQMLGEEAIRAAVRRRLLHYELLPRVLTIRYFEGGIVQIAAHEGHPQRGASLKRGAAVAAYRPPTSRESVGAHLTTYPIAPIRRDNSALTRSNASLRILRTNA